MHGVKRLFAWMIPRFDPTRYNVSLVSLRKKDLSEETLESLGVDITYLHKSKFDPATLPALLKVIDRKQIDILHLHGYGATTFGRLAGGDAAAADDPARAREPDRHAVVPEDRRPRCSSRSTDIAIAVSKSTADFVINARQIPAEQGEGGVPRRAARGVQPAAIAGGDCGGARASSASRPSEFAVGTVTRLHDSKGNSYLVDAARLGARTSVRRRGSSSSAKGRFASRSRRRRARSALAIASSSPASRSDVAARASRRSTSACSRRSGKGRR